MPLTRRLAVLLLIAFACCHCEQNEMGETDLRAARSLTEEYQKALKNELMQALGDGGPVAAVQVCNTKAPEIGSQLTQRVHASWAVKRTAMRTRNAQNRANEVQKRGLSEMQKRISQGEAPDKVEWHQSQGDSFIYMRPIMMGDMCVVCHGEPAAIPSDVKQALTQLYPKDEAVGFSPGDLRGAFVVTGRLAK